MITLLVGLAILLALGLTLVTLARSHRARSMPVRCPVTGHVIVVQFAVPDSGERTDVLTCSALPDAQPITCGLPCLTGSDTLIAERPAANGLDV